MVAIRRRSPILPVFVAFFTTSAAWAQRAGTVPGAAPSLNSRMQLRTVGGVSPLNTFGRVGGSVTMTNSSTGDLLRSGGRGGAPIAPISVGGGYVAPGATNEPGSQFTDRLSRNTKMAQQLFGQTRATMLLGRTTTSGLGDTLSIGGTPFRPRPRTAGAPAFRPGMTPAAFFLDRSLFLKPKSPLARLALGPRRLPESASTPLDIPAAASGVAPGGAAVSFGGAAEEADSAATASGMTFEQRRALRAERDYLKCLEQGNEYARSGDLARARSSFQRASLYDADRPEPYLKLAVVAMLMNDPAQSGVYIRHGLRRLKGADDLRVSVADFVSKEEELRKLVAALGQRPVSSPTAAAERVLAAFLYWILNDGAAARTEAQRAMELAPDWVEAADFARFLQTTNEQKAGR